MALPLDSQENMRTQFSHDQKQPQLILGNGFRGEPRYAPYDRILLSAQPNVRGPLLYAPTTERRRAQRGTKRSGVSSKNIFRSHS